MDSKIVDELAERMGKTGIPPTIMNGDRLSAFKLGVEVTISSLKKMIEESNSKKKEDESNK